MTVAVIRSAGSDVTSAGGGGTDWCRSLPGVPDSTLGENTWKCLTCKYERLTAWCSLGGSPDMFLHPKIENRLHRNVPT